MKTDLVALTKALATADPQAIHAVLFPPAPVADPGPAAHWLASHFLRRFADLLDRGWPIDQDEWAMLLDLMHDARPNLRKESHESREV
jgi:hypothetical protein